MEPWPRWVLRPCELGSGPAVRVVRVCWEPRVSVTVWADRGRFVYLGEDIVERRVAVDVAHDERLREARWYGRRRHEIRNALS